jgi:para-nitrobenzyl esterase
MTVGEANRIAHRIAAMTGRAPVIGAMRDLGLDETSAVVARVMLESYGVAYSWATIDRIPLPFCGVIGTEMLPEAVVPAVANGSANGVRVLAGTTRDEVSGFFAAQFPDIQLDSASGRQMLVALGSTPETAERFRASIGDGASDLQVVSAIATEVWAKRPTLDLLRAHGGPNYLYEFAWRSPYFGEDTGAFQGVDLAFSRDDFENFREVPRGRAILGKLPCAELAERMNSAFVDFVATGNPGWGQWSTEERESMRFDEVSTVEYDYGLMEETAGSRR